MQPPCLRYLSPIAQGPVVEGDFLIWAALPVHRPSILFRLKACLNSRPSLTQPWPPHSSAQTSCQACPSELTSPFVITRMLTPERAPPLDLPLFLPCHFSSLQSCLFQEGGSAGVGGNYYSPFGPPRGLVTPSCSQGFSSHWEAASRPPAWRPLFQSGPQHESDASN